MIHLVKLCVGIKDVAALREHVAGAGGDVVHVGTRSTPKRSDELVDGGSLYWVIGGAVRARQRIVSIQTVKLPDGSDRCVLGLEAKVVDTSSAPYRPFQGWRYLEPERAPSDMAAGAEDMPEEMRRALADLGLV